MALSYEAFLIGGIILLVTGVATYFIGKRSPVWAAVFFAAVVLVFIALNYV